MEPDKTSGVPPIPVPPVTTVNPAAQKVYVALPWQKSVTPQTAFAVMALIDKRRCAVSLSYGDAFVAHSRNSCADYFLLSNLDWFLMIDDDVVPPFGNAEWYRRYTGTQTPDEFAGINGLDRLLSRGKSLIGGIYWGRHSAAKAMMGEAGNPKMAELLRKAPMDKVLPTRWVATGFLLIHRQVFLDIEKRFPLLARGANKMGGQWFTSSEANAMDVIRRTREMLSQGVMDGGKAVKALEMLADGEADARANSSLGVGEDVQFCTRAMQAGHQPHVDLSVVCGHIGACSFGPGNTNG
jgi:hypothetical protein